MSFIGASSRGSNRNFERFSHSCPGQGPANGSISSSNSSRKFNIENLESRIQNDRAQVVLLEKEREICELQRKRLQQIHNNLLLLKLEQDGQRDF